MLVTHFFFTPNRLVVSVAGCLGYDVLAIQAFRNPYDSNVSVAGCLGYDVLETEMSNTAHTRGFSCWLFRL